MNPEKMLKFAKIFRRVIYVTLFLYLAHIAYQIWYFLTYVVSK